LDFNWFRLWSRGGPAINPQVQLWAGVLLASWASISLRRRTLLSGVN
jgi:hypothetical protein